MNYLLILSHIVVAIIAFAICCYWHKRKTCNAKGNFNSSALISDDATNTLVKYFNTSVAQAFNPTNIPHFEEAKLAYVTFADLKKYMCFIEDLSKKNGYKNICNLGISMYYGRYPDKDDDMEIYKQNKTVEPNSNGHHTLVMVPAFNNGKKNIDFNPHFIDKDGPMSHEKIRAEKMKKNRTNKPAPMALKGVFGGPTGGASSTDDDSTNVNLNSFGLTPPNSNAGTSYPY